MQLFSGSISYRLVTVVCVLLYSLDGYILLLYVSGVLVGYIFLLYNCSEVVGYIPVLYILGGVVGYILVLCILDGVVGYIPSPPGSDTSI